MTEAEEKRIRRAATFDSDSSFDGGIVLALLAEIDRMRIENQHLNERLGEAEINVKGAEFGEGQAMAEIELLKSERDNLIRVLMLAKAALREAHVNFDMDPRLEVIVENALKEIAALDETP